MHKLNTLKTHLAALTPTPTPTPTTPRATNEDCQRMVVPFRLWEVNYVYQGGRLIDARVLPITVTRFGIDEGCTAPSISFTDVHGRKARASVNMFYLAEHDAYQEVAQATAAERKEAALDYLQNEALPTLSRLVAAVELLDAAVNQQSDRSTFYWQAKAVLEQLN